MEKLYYGCIYGDDGRYVKITLKGEPNNIASFIARCPITTKVQIVTLADTPVLDTLGNIIFNCSDINVREEIINPLQQMQMYEIAPNPIDFVYGEEEIAYNTVSKEEFIAWVFETTGYHLVEWDDCEDESEEE